MMYLRIACSRATRRDATLQMPRDSRKTMPEMYHFAREHTEVRSVQPGSVALRDAAEYGLSEVRLEHT